MNQQINTKVIIGIISVVVLALGVVMYRTLTAPTAGARASARHETVAPPTMPSDEARRKMQEARTAH